MIRTMDVVARADESDADLGGFTTPPGSAFLLEPVGSGARYPLRVIPDGDQGRAFVLRYPRWVRPGRFGHLRIDGMRPDSRWLLSLADDEHHAAAPPHRGYVELMRANVFEQGFEGGKRYYLPDLPETTSVRRGLHVYDVSQYRAFVAVASLDDVAVSGDGEGLVLRVHRLACDDTEGALSKSYVVDADTPSLREVEQIECAPMNNERGSVRTVYVGEGVQSDVSERRIVRADRWEWVAVSLTSLGPMTGVGDEPSEVVLYGVM
ncbi:hypothetical protein DRW03_06365 [Corallococcus sp. H22C18031201]|nr:hypothetical protein DRW03_06365 [Corallococcus sp. H22C18031201]